MRVFRLLPLLAAAVAATVTRLEMRGWQAYLSESPLSLELWCRESAADKARRIGVFRLDLDRLLQRGYIRRELTGKPGDVRLRIVREPTNDFYIQANPCGPKVLLSEDEVRGNLAGGEADA